MLIEAAEVLGDRRFTTRSPEIKSIKNALYMPLDSAPDVSPTWGVYSESGILCEEAAYKRGPGRRLIGQSDRLAEMPAGADAVDYPIVYGGMAHEHFGHFLLCVLTRFWASYQAHFRGAKILVHVPGSLEKWLGLPFVKDSLSAAGVDLSDFITFDRPTVVADLIVPEPLLIEQSQVHLALDSFGAALGWKLAGIPRHTDQPLYISKENVRSGIWTCVNESALVEVMRARGALIYYPEQHTLGEQIATLSSHVNILGLQGSAQHTTMFCPSPRNIVALGSSREIVSNFHLIDAAKKSRGRYVYPEGGMDRAEPDPAYHITYRLPDPVGCANAMLALL